MGVTPMEGHEVRLAVDQTIGGESNVFLSLTTPVAAGVYTLSPRIDAKGKLGGFVTGEYRASYRPSYRVYFVNVGLDEFDNAVDGSVSLGLTRRDKLTAAASYFNFNSLQALAETNPDGSFDILASNRGRVVRASADVDYTRSLSQSEQFSLQGSFQDYGYENSNNVGNKALGFTASYTTAQSARLTLGGNLTARYRIFDDQQAVVASIPVEVKGSRVTLANLNVLVSYAISPTLNINFQGGPSLIRTVPGGIAGGPAGASDNDFTYFASASVAREFKESNMRLSYERSEDPSGGLNRTSISDTVLLRLSRRLGEEWGFSAAVGWSRRRAVDEFLVPGVVPGSFVPLSRQSRLDRAWGLAEASRRLWKKFRISLTLRYQRWIENSIGGVEQPEQENYSGMMGFHYSFEPYVF